MLLLKTEKFYFGLIKGNKLDKGEEWLSLIEEVAFRGCRNSFRKIFNHFFPLLIGVGVKSGLSKEVSVELAQETMVRVWSQAASFDVSKGNVELWIFVIARNLRFDYFRKHKNDPLQVSSGDIYFDDSANLSDEREELFDIVRLKEQIPKLSTDQRDIIQKIYFEGLTQQEVAEKLNIPLGTVKSRVRLAIAAIKKFMGESK